MAKNRLADWDTTAGNNTDVGGISIAEGWAPENVNNAARETMAQLAEFFKDTTGTITSTNIANAYSITTNDGVTAYAAGQKYAFIVNAANTGAATLNVNTIGAKSLVKNHDLALESGDIEANQVLLVAYEATDDTFQIISQLAQVITEGANVDIANTTAETDIDISADSILVYDDSASANREAALSDVVDILRQSSQATTSGTSKTFTGLPAWAKKHTIVLDQVGMDGTDDIFVQIGDSGGYEATGYESLSLTQNIAGGASGSEETTAFHIRVSNVSGSVDGAMTLYNITGNVWVMEANARVLASQNLSQSGGRKALSGTMDRLQVFTSGTDNFDAGQVNVLSE